MATQSSVVVKGVHHRSAVTATVTVIAELDSVSPTSGFDAGGTSLVLIGRGLLGATSVTVGGISVPFVVNSDGQITITATPEHDPGTVDIAINGPRGAATLAGAYTYVVTVPLTVVSCSPTHAPYSASTPLTLTGTGFRGVVAVELEPYIAGVSFVIVNDETMTLTFDGTSLGAQPADSVDFRIVRTISIDEVTGVGLFTCDYPTPAFASINTSTGTTAGGTAVTLTGTGFTGASGVTFGGSAATSVVVVDDTTITCNTPAHAAGAVDIVIANPQFDSGTSGAAAFTYQIPVPVVVGISPSSGSPSGSTHVVIEVDDSTGATSAALDGVNLTSFAVDDGTHVSGDTVAHAAGAVNVTVTNGGGTSSPLVDGYTYADPVAVVVGIAPLYGNTAGGTVVVIEVDNSTGFTGAKVGGVSLTSTSIVDGTHVQGTTGAHAVGASDVVVTNAGGDSSPLAGGYVYCANDPTAWWEGSYGGAPWLPTTSDGTSGGTVPVPRTLATFGSHSAAGVGSAVDGKTPGTFNGTSQAMQPSESTGQTLGASAATFTILVMMRTVATQAASGTWFHDPGIVMDSGGWGGLVITNSGLAAGLDGPTVSTTALAQPSAGSWLMGVARYDSAHLDCRLNATDATPVVATGHGTFGSALYIGVNYQETQYFHGEMLTIKMWDRRLSNAELDAEYALLKLKYPSAALP